MCAMLPVLSHYALHTPPEASLCATLRCDCYYRDGVAAANYHNSRSVIAGLFLSCTFVGYAFLHIASREWVFPLHMDNIHDYEI